MKEATGELNMTVVVVVAVGVLAAFFYTIIGPMISGNLNSKSKCSNAVCDPNSVNNGIAKCKYKDEKGNSSNLECVWKG